jgi:hypothetical protein
MGVYSVLKPQTAAPSGKFLNASSFLTPSHVERNRRREMANQSLHNVIPVASPKGYAVERKFSRGGLTVSGSSFVSMGWTSQFRQWLLATLEGEIARLATLRLVLFTTLSTNITAFPDVQCSRVESKWF